MKAMTEIGFDQPEVAAVFAAYPRKIQSRLLALRRMIFEVAAVTPGVGELEETLKWGQPSYLTTSSKSGTTIRLDRLSGSADQYALFVSCQTDLVAQFKEIYPNSFRFQGTRAVVMSTEDAVPVEALRHCIALALTYKARKKTEKLPRL